MAWYRGVRLSRAAGSIHMEGQSLIELALLLPVLLLMLAGIVDLGGAFRVQSLLINGAREGAHYGTLHADDTTTIRTKVTNSLAGSGVTIANPSACPDICITYPNGNSSGNPIQVQVQYRYTPILTRILGFGFFTIQANTQAVIF